MAHCVDEEEQLFLPMAVVVAGGSLSTARDVHYVGLVASIIEGALRKCWPGPCLRRNFVV